MTDDKPRRSLGRGVPLTRLQWTAIVAAVVVAVVGMTTLIIPGSPWAGAVGGIAGIVISAVVFTGWTRNERMRQGT
jgi:heme O synthase-like polyprenyltransferase